MSRPKLISFDVCPFVQRSVITLIHKKVDFEITYIDLANKPDWFLKLSPFGKVPVLEVDGEVLFESAVINEYLDDTYEPRLHPENTLQKAKNRAWIEYGSGLIMDMYFWSIAENLDDHDQTQNRYFDNLQKLEDQLTETPFFNGDAFSLVDAAYAPLLQRQLILDEALGLNVLDKYPKLNVWAHSIVPLEVVQESVKPEFKELFLNFIKTKNSIMGQHLTKVPA